MLKSISRMLASSLLLCVFFVAAGSALAQWDVLYDEDKEHVDPEPKDDVVDEEPEKDEDEQSDEEPVARIKRPQAQTCPNLPENILIIGHEPNTQCQVVTEAGVGRMDLIELGIGAALDVWHTVPNSVDVCFQQSGYLVFLDAAYSPRMLKPLLSYTRDGMTCGRIDRAGTVVLLHEPMIFDEPLVPSNPVPVENCVIKLVETLYLRAAPGGEIIGLVWQNSEVPVIEINGYWYKVEFEGVTGYISRFFRTVLRGDCG